MKVSELEKVLTHLEDNCQNDESIIKSTKSLKKLIVDAMFNPSIKNVEAIPQKNNDSDYYWKVTLSSNEIILY